MRRLLTLCMIITTILVLATACSTMNRYVTKIHMSEPNSYTETLTFEDDGDYRTVRLEIDLDFSQGQASFVAVDPNGRELWSDIIEGKQKIRNKYEPVPGVWALEITVTDAVGSIEAAWRPVR